ncbi:ABC transporter substrate-binding protein [Halobacillus andaensis]|uniref:ABC transporter substrate-binding protein n=1 Tax=Halobacillus andaensis TaxID=1176239 RepID=UPI003D7381CE
MKNKTWQSIVFIGLLVFVLAACSGQSAEDAEGGGGGTSNDSDAINLWAPFSGPDGPKFKEIVEEYNESQDEYEVNLQIVPQSEYYKTVDLAVNGERNMPDMFVMHGDQIISYSNKDVLKNLDDIVGDTIQEDNYHEKGWEGATVDGELYGVPLDIHPLMFYWNKDLFEEAGLDPERAPADRDEFLEYAEKLTDKDNQQYGFAMPTQWPQEFIFPTLVTQNGGSLMEDGEITYNSEPVLEALEFEASIIENGFSPADVQQDGEVTLFLQGKNAMHLNGPWMMEQFEESDVNYGVAPVPQLGTEQPGVYANSHNFVLPEDVDEDKIEGITDFINYVGDNGMSWAESGQAPAAKATYESDEFQEMKQQPEVAKQFDDVKFNPEVENWGQLSDPLYDAINEALLGQKEPKDALDDAQKQAESQLEE